ncbi:HEAT repeat domain-containing protein [Maritalea sp.]|uniref:HEAT repeat domain-containing protein n=1 Tax=Maritalea sp. TaxID=2003361 RepID=UPI003EF185D3
MIELIELIEKVIRNLSIANCRAFVSGIGSTLSVFPYDVYFLDRKSSYKSDLQERILTLEQRLAHSGLIYDVGNKKSETLYSDTLSFDVSKRLSSAREFSKLGAVGAGTISIMLKDHDISVRDSILRCFTNPDDEKIKQILVLLDHPDEKVRSQLLRMLGQMGEAAKDPLLKMTYDLDHRFRSYALYAMIEAEIENLQMFDRALEMKTDESEYVRKRVADFIAMYGYLDLEKSRGVVEDLLTDDSSMVVLASLEALSCFQTNQLENFIRLVELLVFSSSPEIRNASISFLNTLEGSKNV